MADTKNQKRDTYTIYDDEGIGTVQIADEVVAIIAGLAATEAIDSLERVAPLRAAMPPKVRATRPMLPPAPIGVPPSTTASRT